MPLIKIRQNNFRREGKMNSKRYRSLLAETTDEHLRHEFLKLIAQEGRQHYMLQIAEKNISNPSPRKTALLAPQTERPPRGGPSEIRSGVLAAWMSAGYHAHGHE
jgi:hypothetical protein